MVHQDPSRAGPPQHGSPGPKQGPPQHGSPGPKQGPPQHGSPGPKHTKRTLNTHVHQVDPRSQAGPPQHAESSGPKLITAWFTRSQAGPHSMIHQVPSRAPQHLFTRYNQVPAGAKSDDSPGPKQGPHSMAHQVPSRAPHSMAHQVPSRAPHSMAHQVPSTPKDPQHGSLTQNTAESSAQLIKRRFTLCDIPKDFCTVQQPNLYLTQCKLWLE
nr:proline-rich protein 2-like [Procambarus clarkii]